MDPSKLDRIVADARRAALERGQSYREQALKIYPWGDDDAMTARRLRAGDARAEEVRRAARSPGDRRQQIHQLRELHRPSMEGPGLSMKLNAAQFVQLEAIKRYSEACKESKSCVIVQGSAPVLVGGR
jgi:hypothetical protein